ncbi:hypothetical protein AgCh_008011 [Apium graveolens]
MLTEEEWVKRENAEGKLLFIREEWMRRSKRTGTETSPGTRTRGNSSYQGVGDRSKIRCFNCHAYGHFAAECRRPRRERDQKPEVNLTQIQDDEPVLLIAEKEVVPRLRNNESENFETNIWYLDNGASNHMTGDRSKLKELDIGLAGKVRFGDGSTVEIKGKGSIMFKTKSGGNVVLREVYFIPTLRNNIISLGQLSESGNRVILNGDFLWVYSEDGRLVMKSEESSWLWHSHLGHVNFQALVHMSKNGMAYGLPHITQLKQICTRCLMAKQIRQPFLCQTNFNAKQAFELVYGDLCGPISPPTKTGNRYFFLLVDDFSKYMWVYLLTSKDEAYEVFKKFRVMVKRENEKKVKVFRTDRGGEFNSKAFSTYCEDTGITRHLTAPYTPQQNGVVERRNRTIVAMARSFIKERKLPSWFWGEAIRHSVYVLNRLSTRSLSEKTPYEALKGDKPDIGHLKIFGCLAYMTIPSTLVSKLEDRSKATIYLGREPGSKACRLYDPVVNKILLSRDVVFDEQKTWDWEENSEQQNKMEGGFVVFDSSAEMEADAYHDTEPMSPVRSSGTSTDTSGTQETEEVYDESEEVEIEEELMLGAVDEPLNYNQAMTEGVWKKAMKAEIESIEKNETWELTK